MGQNMEVPFPEQWQRFAQVELVKLVSATRFYIQGQNFNYLIAITHNTYSEPNCSNPRHLTPVACDRKFPVRNLGCKQRHKVLGMNS